MGLYLFRLPDVGEGVAEAEIGAWHVKAGDRIREDQPLVDVMTDKASVEITSPVTGTVTSVHGQVGDFAPVGSVIVELDPESADAGDAGRPAAPVVEAVVAPVSAADPAQTSAEAPSPSSGPAPLAAPATRLRAHELGVPLSSVQGSGPDGRIRPADLDAHIARTAATAGDAAVAAPEFIEVRILGLRRKIAERMQEATRRIPHFSYVEEFDLTDLEALRGQLNAERPEGAPKLTLLPFFMLAIVRLQPAFPNINARYDDEAGVLRTYRCVHIGVATQTSEGLMVPVVHNVETLGLWGCARQIARAAAAARDGTATREQLSGSTITLTSLGALGGIAATPVINAPEVAILGPNKLVERPVVRGGQVVIRTLMNLSSSFDHRIIDGHQAASYIQQLKSLIESPARLFIGRP